MESDVYLVPIEFLREDDALSQLRHVVISVREFRNRR